MPEKKQKKNQNQRTVKEMLQYWKQKQTHQKNTEPRQETEDIIKEEKLLLTRKLLLTEPERGVGIETETEKTEPDQTALRKMLLTETETPDQELMTVVPIDPNRTLPNHDQPPPEPKPPIDPNRTLPNQKPNHDQPPPEPKPTKPNIMPPLKPARLRVPWKPNPTSDISKHNKSRRTLTNQTSTQPKPNHNPNNPDQTRPETNLSQRTKTNQPTTETNPKPIPNTNLKPNPNTNTMQQTRTQLKPIKTQLDNQTRLNLIGQHQTSETRKPKRKGNPTEEETGTPEKRRKQESLKEILARKAIERENRRKENTAAETGLKPNNKILTFSCSSEGKGYQEQSGTAVPRPQSIGRGGTVLCGTAQRVLGARATSTKQPQREGGTIKDYFKKPAVTKSESD